MEYNSELKIIDPTTGCDWIIGIGILEALFNTFLDFLTFAFS